MVTEWFRGHKTPSASTSFVTESRSAGSMTTGRRAPTVATRARRCSVLNPSRVRIVNPGR